jgi:putative thioredoxin
VDLAALLVGREDFPGADEVLEQVPVELRDARAAQLAAKLGFWKRGQGLPDVAALKARVDAHPDDLDARLAYAERLVADGQYRPALEALLATLRATTGEPRERARKAMLEVFGLAADQPELVGEYRRKLGSALY